ncbi:MAG TPA: coproporphyrinogen III oxidase [Alphaproteobacteria bacterium]|nr:coproporphyrinogen III oxidase [Alphaproteobacteria bacterium]
MTLSADSTCSGRYIEKGVRGNDSLALYFHWPFCLSKCPYCDFNSHVASDVDDAEWRNALLTETKRIAPQLRTRRISSIFFGGGTPSLMAPETVSAILDLVACHWTIDNQAEITLEANPTSSDVGRFRDFRQAGINRLSLGIQALDDTALRFLGRGHNSKEAISAALIAQTVFQRTSVDLIYGRPQQSVKAWCLELEQALELVSDHISLYQLTVEKGTAFYDAHRLGKFTLPQDERALSLFEATQELLDEAGLPAYEISNHAKAGGESKHNLAYWRYQDYVGIGPGAHSRIMIDSQIHALEQIRAPARWLNATIRRNSGSLRDESLTRAQCIREMIMMGLRLRGGIDRKWFMRRLGVDLNNALDLPAVQRMENAGLIVNDAASLRLSARGRTLLDTVLATLLP